MNSSPMKTSAMSFFFGARAHLERWRAERLAQIGLQAGDFFRFHVA